MKIVEVNAYVRTIIADELETRYIAEALQLLAQARRNEFANAIANGYTTEDGFAVELAEIAQCDDMAKIAKEFVDSQDDLC